ncbi:MAG: M14 family zinc carboxypeptidase, partial [Thermoplasmatota archaeon]
MFSVFSGVLGARSVNETSDEQSELESKTDDLPKNDVKDVENSKSFEDCSSVSYDPIIHHMMNKTNESKIEDNIDTLQNFENDQGTKTRRDATSGFWNSTDWVYEKFDSYGLDVFKQNFTYSGKDSTNVIAELPGTDSDVEDETYMIGAHLDSINSLGENEPAPGADDNGAGITVVLESARILSQYDFNRTIRFAAWGGEEFGLQGSDYYVSNIDPEEQDLRGYLNYDMVGYEEDGLAITHHASTPSNWMLDYKSNVTETYDIDSNFTYVYDSDTTSSDHASFWDEGYNATLSIETDFNPYYHTSDDTLDKLTIPQINETAQLAMSTAAHLAELNIEEEYPFPEEYPSIEELYDWYDDLENLYPNLVEKHKFGLSYEEKNLWALEITSDNNTQVEEKPAVLIDGGIHAREWSGPQVSSYYAWRILNEYDSNETIHWLVNNRRIFVVPMTNPDGYEFDGNGDYGERKWWRKNRNTSVGTMIDIGVDLNRNWDIKWEEGDDDPGSSTYHGESPFSENETYYLKEFILENDIDSYQNLHSYAGTLLIPWAYTNDPSPHDDWYRGMAENMTSLTSKYGDKNDHYSYGQAGEEIGYTAPGGAADWVYNETGAQGLTFEIYTGGNGFYPSEENIMTINKDLDDSLIYQTRIADTDLGDGDNESYPPVPHLIYGTVEDENNKPIKNVEVNIKSQETDENLSIPSDSNGYYELNLGNLVNEGYEIGDEFSIKVDSEIKCYFTVDDTWGQKIDLEHTETTGPFPADVPTWEIGSSWTYSQDGWYNDTDSEEYMYLEEELTYTVDDIGYYTLNETDYYGYNLSLEGGVLNGEGQIETDDFGTVEIDIDGGTVNGYMFCKMSDLGVVADDQFRDMEGTAEIAGLTVDFESWTKLTTLSNPPPEEYDFPLNTTDEKFWSNTTSYSSGYNSYVIEGFIEKNETINETVEMSSESVSPYTEEIQVPAGEFEPIYINSTQSEEDSYRDRWYEPEVKSYVKEELESPEVDWIRELESYNVSENPNNLSFDPSEQDIQENLSISGKFPDHGSEEVNIQIPEGAEPKSEWNTTLDEKGKFEKTINVPAAMDMTETNIDFSSVGFVAKIKNKSEYAVATLVIHHDNSPVYPDPKDGAENVSLDVELSTIVAHDKADKLNVTFYDASDDTIIGSEKNVSNGDYASVMWNDLKGDTTYKWYANVTAWGIDSYWESEIWIFTTLATYELSIDSEEGGEVKEPGEGDFEYQSGEVVNLEAVSDEDYYFVKWTGDNETIDDTTSNQTTIEMLDDYSITAEFEINTYELTI